MEKKKKIQIIILISSLSLLYIGLWLGPWYYQKHHPAPIEDDPTNDISANSNSSREASTIERNPEYDEQYIKVMNALLDMQIEDNFSLLIKDDTDTYDLIYQDAENMILAKNDLRYTVQGDNVTVGDGGALTVDDENMYDIYDTIQKYLELMQNYCNNYLFSGSLDYTDDKGNKWSGKITCNENLLNINMQCKYQTLEVCLDHIGTTSLTDIR